MLSAWRSTKDLAIATATDGKVRAFDLATGDRSGFTTRKRRSSLRSRWIQRRAYAGDLKGVVHAFNLADGTSKWKFDLGAEPIKSPGMVYGGPVLSGGKLYVATCNLEGRCAEADGRGVYRREVGRSFASVMRRCASGAVL